MPRVMVVTGFKKSGKTSLIEKLIGSLKRRGLKVGVIKHTMRAYGVDTRDKDTWRYKQAGAEISVLLTPEESAFFLKYSLSANEAMTFFSSYDIVLLEGFKELDSAPRIIVATEIEDVKQLSNGLEVAIVTPGLAGTLGSLSVPVFNPVDIEKVADMVEKMAMPLVAGRNCGKCGYSSCKDLARAVLAKEAEADRCVNLPSQDVQVLLDGAPLDVNPFVGNVIRNVVLGVLSTLKGVGKPNTVQVQFKGYNEDEKR